MDLVFEQIRTGGDRNLAYLVGDRSAGVALAVDPSYDPRRVYERARAQGLAITLILNTHGHVDHVNGNDDLRRLTDARVAAHLGSSIQPGVPLSDGQVLHVGALPLRVLHVPGHAPDHLLVHLPTARAALTGDHLFVGKVGGTSTEREALTEWASLQRTLTELPDETTIWPGHDYGCRPSSTIALERRTNPFLLCKDADAFLALKRDWSTFKAERGLV